MSLAAALLPLMAAAALASLAPSALAQDVTLSAEHEEYYFLVGEAALFRIQVNSTYAEPVAGTLVSKIEHIDDALGIQFSESNSEFTNLSPGESGIDVNLGTHAESTSLSVDILFSYVEGSAKLVDLDPITVHIVDSATPEQQNSEPISASSQEAHIPPQQPSSQTSSSQDRLQNNQLAQDSTALREQIREQLAQDAESREDVLEAARGSEEFAQLDEELRSQGYQMQSQSAAASGESSGSFDFEYADAQGRTASIEGRVEDGEVAEIGVQTSQEIDEALEALRADPRFQELQAQLGSEGYAETDVTATKAPDGSFEASLSYAQTNATAAAEAQITARIVNGTVSDVRLVGETDADGDRTPWPLIAAAIAAAAAAAAAVTVAALLILRARRRADGVAPAARTSPRRDYATESAALLEKADAEFRAGRHKAAYGLVGRALRLGLAHKAGADREMSNEELVGLLEERGFPLGALRDCLGASSLVVFARRVSDPEEFERILGAARDMIRQ